MSAPQSQLHDVLGRTFPFPKRHFLSVMDLNPVEVGDLLDLAAGLDRIAVTHRPSSPR